MVCVLLFGVVAAGMGNQPLNDVDRLLDRGFGTHDLRELDLAELHSVPAPDEK